MEIRVGQVGKIVAGDELGNYVKIVDDCVNTGGYLILTSAEANFEGGFDNWVENKDALARYFVESTWVVDWQ